MRKVDQQAAKVQYPKREYAVALLGEGDAPFSGVLIGKTYPTPDYEIRRPRSPFTVLEYVLEGEGELCLGGKWQTARAGDVYILRAGEDHHYRANPRNPWKKIWINYTADYICAMLTAYGIESGVYRAENARAYFEQLLTSAKQDAPLRATCLGIADLVSHIVYATACARLTDRGDAARIKEALGAAVYGQLDLGELADRLHLSKSGLIRIFKKSYGITPYEYLLSLKIAAARMLLEDTSMSVKEIAARLCFCDEHYFSSLFLARVGMRPRAYRTARRTNAT